MISAHKHNINGLVHLLKVWQFPSTCCFACSCCPCGGLTEMRSGERRPRVTEVNTGGVMWACRTTVTDGGVRRRLEWLMSISVRYLLIFGVIGEAGDLLCVPDGRGHPAVKRTQPICKHFHLSAAGKAAGRTDGGFTSPLTHLILFWQTSTRQQQCRGSVCTWKDLHSLITSLLVVDFLWTLTSAASRAPLGCCTCKSWWPNWVSSYLKTFGFAVHETQDAQTYQVNTDPWSFLHFHLFHSITLATCFRQLFQEKPFLSIHLYLKLRFLKMVSREKESADQMLILFVLIICVVGPA